MATLTTGFLANSGYTGRWNHKPTNHNWGGPVKIARTCPLEVFHNSFSRSRCFAKCANFVHIFQPIRCFFWKLVGTEDYNMLFNCGRNIDGDTSTCGIIVTITILLIYIIPLQYYLKQVRFFFNTFSENLALDTSRYCN